ncbi:MAG: excinuclease ABC subunit UvrA [Isosphaeraceae bacterium]
MSRRRRQDDQAPASPLDDESIRVRGARVHNLRSVDVDLPRDRLVVLTGVSGSGKSSLAFDTLFAEAQRRYIESLSGPARQFLDQMERPDVDSIEGLPPTVSVDQKTGTSSPRSTVATLTEIHDYLRVLFARTGIPHCPKCGESIRRQTPEQMVATVLALKVGQKVMVLAPLVRGRKGQHAEAFQAIRRAGLLRARVDGEVIEVTLDDPVLAKSRTHSIEAVIDRLVVREGIRARLAESIDLALKLGDGTILLTAQMETGWVDTPLSVHFACPTCGTGLEELEPRTFSFNSPYGACPACDGLGTTSPFDPELVIPDPSRSLAEGAVSPWSRLPSMGTASGGEPDWVDRFLRSSKLTRDRPLESWPSVVFNRFVHGDPETQNASSRSVPGILPELEALEQRTTSERIKQRFAEFRSPVTCEVCAGTGLRAEARSVTVSGETLPQFLERDLVDALARVQSLTFEEAQKPVGLPLVTEIERRLSFLNEVGLGYLTLARRADTLSGGELQRVRVATQIGSGLMGVGYVLDEPTAGLHPSDTERLLQSLFRLRDRGNSVIVVEHDEATIRAADWVVDLGPGAGPDGGQVVAFGPPEDLRILGESSTARYLSKPPALEGRGSGRLSRSQNHVLIRGARVRNLKGIDLTLPVGCLCAISGVSGSGKSTLAHEVIARSARRYLNHQGGRSIGCEAVEGLEAFNQFIAIDQSPIGRGPRSTPATAVGVFDEIRRVFARTREAKLRGYGASRFSFNVKGGRCEACEGLGVQRIRMSFLPDLTVRCSSCRGLRYNDGTLEVRFKGRSIGEVLELRVDESREFFSAHPRVLRGLQALHEAGLGYLTLGQSSSTLSGGEAQRVKLAAELGRAATGKTLYLLDEPTAGLHFDDVQRLIRVLEGLADQGNTVVVIEHNLDLLRASDWLIDLGPGGGDAGGRLVAMGTPQEVERAPESLTGRYLNIQ